jgi:hypothetical protein
MRDWVYEDDVSPCSLFDCCDVRLISRRVGLEIEPDDPLGLFDDYEISVVFGERSLSQADHRFGLP